MSRRELSLAQLLRGSPWERALARAPSMGSPTAERLGGWRKKESFGAHFYFGACCQGMVGLNNFVPNAPSEAHVPVYKWLWVKTNGIPFWGRCTTHFRTNFSQDWDVHWGYGILTHGQIRTHLQPAVHLYLKCPCVVYFGHQSTTLEG